ncbi:MAG: helicase SNF2, partial [Gemmiger qucibialis]
DHAREKDTAAWLAQEYSGSNIPFVVRAGSPEETQLPWPKVQRRLAQLIQEDRFYTEEEQDRFDNIDPIAIREALEERGIVNGQVADPEKLDNDPFIQQVVSDVEQIAAAEIEQPSEVSISDEEYDAVRSPIPQKTSYDPAAPVYAVGDTVYIEDAAYQITGLRDDTVQLLPTGMVYPIYRAERKEQFEQLLRADRRNAYYTEFLPIDPDKADQDLRDVLAHGLMDEADKQQLSTLLQSGRSNSEIAYWLSRTYPREIETLDLENGDIADYRTTTQGMELEVMDAEEKRLAVLYFRWDEVAPLLRGMYARQLDGFGQEQPQPSAESPAFHSETVAVYPGDKNHLPYDVVVERLHIEEPEPPAPVTEPEKNFEEVLDEHPVSIQVNGQWQTFPNAKAAEEASYEEYKDNLRRNAQNFRITDEHLGEGGPKAKFQANVNAIRLLKELESAGQQASPEQQEILSRYVGWGGIPDAFDPEKPAWALEYAQLKELLTRSEYAAARSSTLNAHYTSPTVIQAIYEAVDRMGFETGNILEPSMG